MRSQPGGQSGVRGYLAGTLIVLRERDLAAPTLGNLRKSPDRP